MCGLSGTVLGWHRAASDGDFNSPVVKGMGRYNAKENTGERTLSDDELRAVWKATDSPDPFLSPIRALFIVDQRPPR